MLNFANILSALPTLLTEGGALSDDVTALVSKVENLFAAIEAAVPYVETFLENLEHSANAEAASVFSGVISAFKDVSSQTKTVVSTATQTAQNVSTAVANTNAT